MGNTLGKSSSIYDRNSDSLSDNDILIINNIIESYIEELEELNIIQYNTFRTTLKDNYIINYLIIDQEKYNNVLNEINDRLENVGIDISNL